MPRARGQRPQRTVRRAAARTPVIQNSEQAVQETGQNVREDRTSGGADRGAPIRPISKSPPQESEATRATQGPAATVPAGGSGGEQREAGPGPVSPPAAGQRIGSAGRPPKDTPEARARFIEGLRAGAYRKEACLYAGFSEDSLARYLHADADFKDQVEKAEANAYMRNLAIIQKAGEKNWQAAAWFLERKFPGEWTRRYEMAGPGGGPIPVQHDLSKLPADKLLALREILALAENPGMIGGEGARRN